MKKILLIAFMMVMSIGAFAQSGKFAFGPHFGYAGFGDGYNPLGVGFQGRYYFTDQIRGEFQYEYWFPKDGGNLYGMDFNFHYLIPVDNKFNFYPIVGGTWMISSGGGNSEAIFGLNFGAGAEYLVAENLWLNFDFMYKSAKKTKQESVTVMGYTTTVEYDLKATGPIFQIGLTRVF